MHTRIPVATSMHADRHRGRFSDGHLTYRPHWEKRQPNACVVTKHFSMPTHLSVAQVYTNAVLLLTSIPAATSLYEDRAKVSHHILTSEATNSSRMLAWSQKHPNPVYTLPYSIATLNTYAVLHTRIPAISLVPCSSHYAGAIGSIAQMPHTRSLLVRSFRWAGGVGSIFQMRPSLATNAQLLSIWKTSPHIPRTRRYAV